MRTIKRFIWFTTHSWSYMQGMRSNYFKGFWGAWSKYNESAKQDEKAGFPHV